MIPKKQEPDFSNLNPRELAELGIYTPVEKCGDPLHPYWIIPNQKIVAVDADLPGLRKFIESQKEAGGHRPKGVRSAPKDIISHPPALENSLKNFFRSLFDLLSAWLRWLFGGGKPKPKQPMVGEGGSFGWSFKDHPDKEITFTIVRVCDCPNDKAEFVCDDTVSVLLEWNERFPAPPGDLAHFDELCDQADNILVINSLPPNNGVGWPPRGSGRVVRAYPSDFLEFKQEDRDFYSSREKDCAGKPILAVLDTGLVYKWRDPKTGTIERHYEYDGKQAYFCLANAPSANCAPKAEFGYCGIADYYKRPAPAQLEIPNSIPPDRLSGSPYDDNLVDEEITQDDGTVRLRKRAGRHGTLISAILNQHGSQVLPIKVFNNGGMGSLFDLLCCCNYLMARKRAGMDIKVLNASFSGNLNGAGERLLRSKMKAITEVHDIWVVAAAGNRDVSLDGGSLYPARFGESLPKVITVNAQYGTGLVRGGTGAAVALTAVSPLPGGFPSVLPTDNGGLLEGTSFAVPYVAVAMARLPLDTLSRADVLSAVRGTDVAGVTFR